jgi:hypothetical protein
MNTTDRPMTVTELAEMLGIPVATPNGCRSRGEGQPGYRIGRQVHSRREAIGIRLRFRSDPPVRSGSQDRVSHRRPGLCQLAPMKGTPRTCTPAAMAASRSSDRSMLAPKWATASHWPPVALVLPRDRSAARKRACLFAAPTPSPCN